MKYVCSQCKKVFGMEGETLFCLYCGLKLNGEDHISQTIDRIWGETAKRKAEYKLIVYQAIQNLNEKLRLRIEDAMRNKAKVFSFDDEFSIISTCENRKQVIMQTQKLMRKIREKVYATSLEISESKLEILFEKRDLEIFAERILREIGIDKGSYILDGKVLRKVEYTQDQLIEFYDFLEKAYEKYVRCVMENNMFAAFPSDSTFGNIGRSDDEYHWFNVPSEKIKDKIDFERELNDLKNSLLNTYGGFLDEDFLPHVNSFWKGLKVLSRCIECNEKETIVLPNSIFDDKTLFEIRRRIDEKDFIVTEAKINEIQSLMEEINEK